MVVKKAGCILLKLDTKEIALVSRNGELSFPKGHLEKNETLQECAIRETIEETGRNCHLYSKKEISKINYISSKGENVENYFYIAIDDGIYQGIVDEEDKEILVWKKFIEVENAISYANLKKFWNEIKFEIEKVIKNETL